jgi:tetratricopeptide (TPR) repeat protein
MAEAMELLRRYDIEALLTLTAELLAAHGDDPTVHVIDAFARAIAWDADPRSEALVQLRERLVTLDAADPLSPYDELLRAFVYRASGEPLEAIKLYSRVIERDDLTNANRAWALRQRSFALLQVGRDERARQDAEQSSRLDPVNALSLDALSKAQESLGRLEESITSAERALMLEPGGWRHEQRLGITLARAGRLVEAAERLAHSCALSGAQEACANLAVVLQRDGRDAEALEAARHAETLPATRWGYYNLACYRSLAGEGKRALEDLRRAVDLGFADALIKTDSDLDPIRDDSAFDALLEAIEDRIRIRREQAREVFPWQ